MEGKTMSHTIRAACLAALSMAIALPSPAAAQGFLKHIKNKAKDVAVKKAAEKMAGGAGPAVAVPGAPPQAAPPDQGSMEITSARIDQLIAGLSAERAVYDRVGATPLAGGRPRMPSEAEIKQAQECGKADMQRMQRRQDSIASEPSSGYDRKKAEEMARKAQEKAAKQGNYQSATTKYAVTMDAAGLQRHNDSLMKSHRDASIRAARFMNSQCNVGPAGLTPALIAQADSAGATASGIAGPQYTMLHCGRLAAGRGDRLRLFRRRERDSDDSVASHAGGTSINDEGSSGCSG
jgi:hypothetical protein